jgi:hypothetical protein
MISAGRYPVKLRSTGFCYISPEPVSARSSMVRSMAVVPAWACKQEQGLDLNQAPVFTDNADTTG